jgi:hypothetical protein
MAEERRRYNEAIKTKKVIVKEMEEKDEYRFLKKAIECAEKGEKKKKEIMKETRQGM